MDEVAAVGGEDEIAAFALAETALSAIRGIALLAMDAKVAIAQRLFNDWMQRELIKRIETVDSVLGVELLEPVAQAGLDSISDISNRNLHQPHGIQFTTSDSPRSTRRS